VITIPVTDLIQLLETPYKLEPQINRLKRAEAQEVINSLNPKKSSGYDLVTGKILKELPITGIKYLTQLFNAVLLKEYSRLPSIRLATIRSPYYPA
jgi:hypothetical protein